MSDALALAADLETTPQDQRRTHILESARACFARSGFHGASMHQICAEARMSPGALYRYFPSKESIIEAIAEEERMKASAVMAIFNGPGTIVERFMRAAEAYFELMKRPGGGELMFEICAESTRSAGVGSRFQCIETDTRAAFLAALAEAQASGEVEAGVDLDAAVTMLLAIGDGMSMRLTLHKDIDLDRVLPVLRNALVGILTPSGGRDGGTNLA